MVSCNSKTEIHLRTEDNCEEHSGAFIGHILCLSLPVTEFAHTIHTNRYSPILFHLISPSISTHRLNDNYSHQTAYPSSSMSVHGGGPGSCSFKVQLSPVPIGTKHFAVLFIPESSASTPVPVHSPASVSPLRGQQPPHTLTSTTSSVPIPVPTATPSWSTESLPTTVPHHIDISHMHHY